LKRNAGEKGITPMPQGSACRRRAEECTALAQTARTPAQRTMLLHIAETWLRLAREAEEIDPTDDSEMSPSARWLM
jgi:hypothetical protein